MHNYGSPQLEQDTSTGSRDYHMTKPKDKENDDDDDDDDECKSHDSHVIGETGSIVRFRPRAKVSTINHATNSPHHLPYFVSNNVMHHELFVCVCMLFRV